MGQWLDSLPNVPTKIMGEVHSRQKVGSKKNPQALWDLSNCVMCPALTPNESTVLWEALRHSPKQAPGPRGSKHLRGQIWLPRHCPPASYGGELYSNATFFKTASTTQDRPRDKSWASKVTSEAYPSSGSALPGQGAHLCPTVKTTAWLSRGACGTHVTGQEQTEASLGR